MKLKVPALFTLGAAATAAVIAASPSEHVSDVRTAQKLAAALQGRSAGSPVDCIPNMRGQARMDVVDDWTILYRDGSTVYLQKPLAACTGLKNGRYALVTRKISNEICSTDINQMIDPRTGVYGGSCSFAPFVPYRKAK